MAVRLKHTVPLKVSRTSRHCHDAAGDLPVKLEDLTETEAIFTTLMGENVEARRKFIEDNALDVKNLDI